MIGMKKTKVCRSCDKRKRLDQFYKHATMADGHLNQCKACVRNRVTAHRENNIDAIRQYDRNRGMLPHRVAARAVYEQTDAGKTAMSRAKAKWIVNNPLKRKAQNAVSNAVRDGKLIRPKRCKKCRKVKKLHAHHEDYSQPLVVIWLCIPCHSAVHHGE